MNGAILVVYEGTGETGVPRIRANIPYNPTFPIITTQPQSCTNNAGTEASFKVSASGTEPLAYQWRWNGTNLAGATTNSYTIASAQPTNQGDYTVVVTNLIGSVTSAVARLVVLTSLPRPSISELSLTNGYCSLYLSGQLGPAALIQASTDLKNWRTLGSCVLSDAPVVFSDPQGAQFGQRFYRLVLPYGPPWIEECRSTNGQLAFDLVGEPGGTLVIEASPNLQQWTAIATNALNNVPFPFSDPQSGQLSQRFYRLLKP